MTEVSEEEFLKKLLEVVHKLSNIAKTQSYSLKKKWDDYFKPLNKEPHLIRQIPIDKQKFLNDIDFRKIIDSIFNRKNVVLCHLMR